VEYTVSIEANKNMGCLTTIDPKTFLSPRNLEGILSIVQFGSSLYSENPGDIDLCVVTKKGCFFDLLAEKSFTQVSSNIDISLLKEEELKGTDFFRFGSHGVHLLVSLREGKAIYGENIFLELSAPSERAVKESILDRLYDYLYEVRKLETLKDKDISATLKRWPKFNRLALFLLDTTGELTFPAVLSISESEIEKRFSKYGLQYQDEFTVVGFEHIWETILAKNLQS